MGTHTAACDSSVYCSLHLSWHFELHRCDQTTLRNSFDMQINQAYFNIMSIQGAIFIFTVTLFPYVYAITRSYFQSLSASVLENARLLGGSDVDTFFRVALPISRAAIIGSVTLVILEVLNDYGVTSYYGIQTVSTAIFRTWYGMISRFRVKASRNANDDRDGCVGARALA